MIEVTIYNRSMRDFVTSNMAVMMFATQEDAEQYVENSERFHPDRFWYAIKEQSQQTQSGAMNDAQAA